MDAQGVSRPGNSEGRAAGQAPKAAAGAAGLAGNGGSKPIPHLRWREAAGARAGQRTAELIVDGEPFLILGGELGNSSASSLEYVNAAWPRLRELHLNTVLAPVYWDLIEPEEGRFDFSLVDGLIAGAREHGMRLVLLWFGSWKNCMSCYVPAWIKTDPERFPRVRSSSGQAQEMLSAFYEDNAAADVRAFAALMRHLREVDEAHRTVIMVQVENEIGMIPEPRDYSEAANRAYRSPVPAELIAYLVEHRDELAPELKARWEGQGARTAGTWEDVFGPGVATEEIFQAWHFAVYVQRVAAAGKAEYPLPMYVNAALIRPGYTPGRYASAGPLPHLIDVWRAGAPAIDFLAPDLYFPNVVEWLKRYAAAGNPLFVPEIRKEPSNAAHAFYAVGELGALGISPFSIETADEAADGPLARCYRLLAELAPVILEHREKGAVRGAAPEVSYSGEVRAYSEEVSLGGYRFTFTFEGAGATGIFGPAQPASGGGQASRGSAGPGPAGQGGAQALPGADFSAGQRQWPTGSGGLLIALGGDEFLVAGTGIVLTFACEDSPGETAGILWAQEGEYVDGRWVAGRWLNGDQTHQGRHIRIAPGEIAIQRFRLYRYR